jgi:hypothetical protein
MRRPDALTREIDASFRDRRRGVDCMIDRGATGETGKEEKGVRPH